MTRPDGGSYALQTPEELIAANQQARSEAARKMREMRTFIVGYNGTQEQKREFRTTLTNIIQRSPKLTAAFALKEAMENLRYSRTLLGPNPLDTEYYSACGWEDGELMQRDYARDYAIEMFRVWKWFKKESDAAS